MAKQHQHKHTSYIVFISFRDEYAAKEAVRAIRAETHLHYEMKIRRETMPATDYTKEHFVPDSRY